MDKKSNRGNDNSDLQLIELSSNMLAGLYSVFVANTIQGPEGLYISQTSTPLIANALNVVISSLRERRLSDREKYRTNTSMEFFVKNIKQKIEEGKQVRQDDFFQLDETNRSSAMEVAEGLLMVIQRDPEEKKLKLFGNLLANLVFDESFSKEQANFLIKVSQQLTYRQLCLINIFANNEDYSLRKKDYKGYGEFTTELISIISEVYSLYNMGMISIRGTPILGATSIVPSEMKSHSIGNHLYHLMELWSIEEEVLNMIAKLLE